MIYVHVPFCRSFCTYCDFYSEIACKGRDNEAVGGYADALVAEAESRRDEIQRTLGHDTLYIGGGTPSVLPLSVLSRIVSSLPGAPYDEFTVEVNPEDIVEKGAEYVSGLLGLGVSRVSMGVQSLADGILKWMNRRHDASGAVRAFRTLRGCGVSNISLDVIFGISHLSGETLRGTLDRIVELRPEHVSAYQLGIEEGSALGEMVRAGRYAEADEVQCAGQYSLICEVLAAAGYVHYEISNWALPGFESKHNSAYWARVPYVGLGPGAHSFDGSRRSWNSERLSGWSSSSETLSEAEVREEELMLGLRTARGVPESLCRPETVGRLLRNGALIRSGGRVRIPEDRFFVSDEIIAELV